MRHLGLLLAPLALMLTSCPEARPPVDQTQANAIAKSAFDGEWYFQRTVIDTPYETVFTFIGDQGELERIEWRIEENILLAVRSYVRYDGTEEHDDADGNGEGSPIAAWPIISHFDIRRDYNPVTGEEYNVIVENETDRQWFERDYIRVDWTTQTITNWNFYAPNAVTLESMNLAITDPNDPHAPIVQDGYMEITSSFLAAPAIESDEWWGDVPLCWYFFVFDDCTASEVTVKNSFLRIGDRDYEAAEWTGTDMELFGYFDVSRFSYDENYGPTNAGRMRLQARFNIWTNSHNDTPCESDEECLDLAEPELTATGWQCDELDGRCTRPYRDRGVRRIPYYGSPGLDPRLAVISQEVIDSWNVAMRDTVNALRFYECLDDNFTEDDCEAEKSDSIEVFGWCPNNPIIAGDPSYCGDVGFAPRLGDLRYNFLWSSENPGRGNPFGFGPAQLDPLTGEVISAAAITYTAEVTTYAAWARDIILLLNGELDEQDFIDGENVADWVARSQGALTHQKVYTQDEVAELTAKVQLKHRSSIPNLAPPSHDKATMIEARRHAREVMAHHPAVDGNLAMGRARLDALTNTPIEELLITDEAMIAGATLPGTPLDQATLDRVSPLRRVRDQRLQRAWRARMARNASGPRCAYWREFVDPSVEGYAALYAGVDPEEIQWDLVESLYRGTMAHEMGHTLGLRHNLEGSHDALNYNPEYWALRAEDGSLEPRYLDPETPEEIAGGIRQYQYSSVMDYLSRFNSDELGAQHYDMAAIKFGYGRIMEVFYDEFALDSAWMLNDAYIAHTYGYPMPLNYTEDGELYGLHYTDYWDMVYDFEARIDIPQSKLSDVYGIAAYYDSPHTYLATEEGYPVVPYEFCSDEYAGSGLTCLYFDEGADLYEIPLDLAQRYERYYIMNNFGRDRLWFAPDGYMYRIWDGYFDPMVSLNQWWILWTQDFYASEPPEANVDGFLQAPDGFGPFTMGVRETFNVFARTIARPEPGGYAEGVDTDGNPSWEPLWWSDDFTVGIDEGRYLSTDWDYDEGYFWDEVVHHVGYFTDKTLAMQALFDPTTYFMGQDTAADLRRYRVNYGLNFFDPLMELVGDVMVGDKAGFAPYNVDGAVVFPDYADYPVTPPPGALPINPNADFTIQFHTMVMGLALLPDTFESEIIDSTRIWVVGASDAVGSVLPTVTHVDPDSGLTYEAISYLDDDGDERGVAARMIGRANALQTVLGEQLPDDGGDDDDSGGDDDDSGGDDDDSAGDDDDDDALDPEVAARIQEELRLLRENLNLLRAIHQELGSLDF
jgi:hypothetical protein